MTFTGLIDRLDDTVNPIVVKELRQAVKSRAVAFLLVAFLVLQVFIVGATITLREARNFGNEADWTAGRDLFPWLNGVLAIALTLLVPAYGCIRLTAERSDQNVDLLFISTLKPHSIMAGKLFATLTLGLMVLSACAPFLVFCYLLRGIDMPSILFILLLDVLALVVATMAMMLIATAPGGLILKTVLLVAGYAFFLLPGCYALVGITSEFLWFGSESVDSSEFWVGTLSVSAAVLSGVGMMFVYSVSLVSPSASNRVLAIRLFLLAVWVASAVAVAFACKYSTGYLWTLILRTWLWCIAFMLGLQMVISVSERDQYGPRMRRQIPGNWLLRVPAFFVYSGAANGLAYTLPLIAASLGLGFYWQEVTAATFARTSGDVPVLTEVMLLFALYGYCYGMSGVLVRVYLLGGQLRAGLTWLITGLLIGVGSSVPPAVAFALFKDQMRAGTEHIWYKLPSPFISAYESVSDFPSGRVMWDYYEVCLWFLGVWAVLVTALATPWFVRQVLSFAPKRREQVPADRSEAPPAPPAPQRAKAAEAPPHAVQPAAVQPAEVRS